jgi:hypothetical protein
MGKNRESVRTSTGVKHPSCDGGLHPLYPVVTGAKCPWAASIFVGDKGYCRNHTTEAQAAIDDIVRNIKHFVSVHDGMLRMEMLQKNIDFLKEMVSDGAN